MDIQLGKHRSLALCGLQPPHHMVELALEDDAGREGSEPLLLHHFQQLGRGGAVKIFSQNINESIS